MKNRLSYTFEFTSLTSLLPTADTIIWLVRLLCAANALIALRPILPYVSQNDEMSDIPLTPSQRALLGLSPSTISTPASAQSIGPGSYITPPRYRRSSASFARSPGSGQSADHSSVVANYNSSPFSTSRYTVGFSPSPAPQSGYRRTASGSPFSPASPLFHKAVGSSSSHAEINSFGDSFSRSTGFRINSGTGLGRSQSVRERGARGAQEEPGTPSPVGASKLKGKPGLNYKYLYDKGGKLPRSESMGF